MRLKKKKDSRLENLLPVYPCGASLHVTHQAIDSLSLYHIIPLHTLSLFHPLFHRLIPSLLIPLIHCTSLHHD